MATDTVDNPLYFVSSNFDNTDRQQLNSLLVNSYQLEELTTSKNNLIAECEKIDIAESIADFKKKRLLTKTDADLKQKIAKDILDIWAVVDVQKGGQFKTNFVHSVPPCLPQSSSPPPT